MDALIDEMATKYKDDKKLDLEAAKAQLIEKMSAADSKMHGTTVCLAAPAALALHFISSPPPMRLNVIVAVCDFLAGIGVAENRLDLGVDPDHDPNSGIWTRLRTSLFSGYQKSYERILMNFGPRTRR